MLLARIDAARFRHRLDALSTHTGTSCHHGD